MHENGTLVANGSLVHAVVHYLMPQLMSISAGASRNTQRYASLLKIPRYRIFDIYYFGSIVHRI